MQIMLVVPGISHCILLEMQGYQSSICMYAVHNVNVKIIFIFFLQNIIIKKKNTTLPM